MITLTRVNKGKSAESIEIDRAMLRSLYSASNHLALDDQLNLVTYRDGRRKKVQIQVLESKQQIADMVRQEIKEGTPLSERYPNAYIKLLREQCGTAHGVLCPVCGGIHQIYHNRCGCKIEPEYKGKETFSKVNGRVMTQQMVFSTDEDIEKAGLDIKTDFIGLFEKRCKITHITESLDNDGLKKLDGRVVINKQSIRVDCHPEDKLKDNMWHFVD